MKNLPKEIDISSDEIFHVSFLRKGNRHTHENVVCAWWVPCNISIDLS